MSDMTCGCMGPQGDQPVCPCAMATVIRWRGVWINLTPIQGRQPEPDYLASVVDLSDVPVTEMSPEQRKQRLAELRK